MESAEGTVLRRTEGLKAQQERLVLYKEQLAKSEMRAPQDGLVIYARSSSRYNDTYIKEGALIRKGYSVIDLPDISELMAVVQVHESFVRHIKTGQKAVVRIDSLPDREFRESSGTLRQRPMRAVSITKTFRCTIRTCGYKTRIRSYPRTSSRAYPLRPRLLWPS